MSYGLGDDLGMFGRLLALHRLGQLQMSGRDNSGDDGPRIRELDDESSGPSSSLSSALPSSFEQLMQLGARSADYMEKGKYEEAYGLVKKQYKLGPQANFASVLVNYYSALMNTERAEKASKIRNELLTLFEDKLEASPEELEKYGNKLRKQKKYFSAILFYQIASELCEKESNAGDAISALQGCALGTKLAVSELLENHVTSKLLIKKHVIPIMRKIKERIGRHGSSVDPKLICIVQALALHHTEHCEFLVGDIEAREKSIQEAIGLMRKHLGSDADKHHLFGGHLNNLAHTYLIQNRPKDAAKFFAQAITSKQKAQDYDTAAEKREDIQKSERALQLARKQF